MPAAAPSPHGGATSSWAGQGWRSALCFLAGAVSAFLCVLPLASLPAAPGARETPAWSGRRRRGPHTAESAWASIPASPLQPPLRRPLSSPHLVVAHFKEDLSWLTAGWGARYTHTVYEMGRAGGAAPDFSRGFTEYAGEGGERVYLTNWGDESSGYLRFIIDHYDNLPEITVFLHGDPEGHNRQISTWIDCVRKDTWFTFLTRAFIDNRCIVDAQNTSLIPKYDFGAFVDFWLRFPWASVGVGGLPRCLSFYCCAEFAVGREAIRSRPLEFWRRMWSFTLDYVLNQNVARRFKGWSLRQIGGIFEHSWHVLFGEPMHMQRYDPCRHFEPRCGPCHSSDGGPPPNRPEQRRGGGIRVQEAWFGAACGTPTPKNATAWLTHVKESCDGRLDCAYEADPSAVGYPFRGCEQMDYRVAWQCMSDPPGSPPRRADAALAGPGAARVQLHCPRPDRLPPPRLPQPPARLEPAGGERT
eukprot:TRINITY_DN47698_c0_g1_i1.p1 TRINITY_DN47698_c0_g1~~TRINITY_DN47698_c0_g1_i1.p1  ORF type:complete len:504 (+),score=139.38 TRINITY_DN47698_c0_g1_i1:97-1512(+)